LHRTFAGRGDREQEGRLGARADNRCASNARCRRRRWREDAGITG